MTKKKMSLNRKEKQIFMRSLVEGVTIVTQVQCYEFLEDLEKRFNSSSIHEFNAVLGKNGITYYAKSGFPLISTIYNDDHFEFRQVNNIMSFDKETMSDVGGAVLSIINVLARMNEDGRYNIVLPIPVQPKETTYHFDDEFGGI